MLQKFSLKCNRTEGLTRTAEQYTLASLSQQNWKTVIEMEKICLCIIISEKFADFASIQNTLSADMCCGTDGRELREVAK